MKEETAKTVAEEVCDLFNVDANDSIAFFEVYDIIRDNLYKENIELPVA